MARKSRQGGSARPAEAHREPAAGAAPATALGKARWMLEAGDVRRARAFAEEASASGPEAERAEARALLERLRPDPFALLVVAGVLVAIVIAAWLAILRTH